jgi:hypothetical protein
MSAASPFVCCDLRMVSVHERGHRHVADLFGCTAVSFINPDGQSGECLFIDPHCNEAVRVISLAGAAAEWLYAHGDHGAGELWEGYRTGNLRRLMSATDIEGTGEVDRGLVKRTLLKLRQCWPEIQRGSEIDLALFAFERRRAEAESRSPGPA